jgi:hypothetical protein
LFYRHILGAIPFAAKDAALDQVQKSPKTRFSHQKSDSVQLDVPFEPSIF